MQEILAQQEPLPSNIRFGTHIESVRAILAFAEGAEHIYIARLDSDDLYHRTFVQQLYDVQPQPQTMALINQNGYLWDSVNNEMAPAFHRSPQFYVYLYKTAEYAAGYRVKLPGRGTHGNVIDLPHELPLRAITSTSFIQTTRRLKGTAKRPVKPGRDGSGIT